MVLHVLKLLVGEKEHQLGPEAAQNQEHVPNGKKLASLACRNTDPDAPRVTKQWGRPAPSLLTPKQLKQTLFLSWWSADTIAIDSAM